MRASEQPSWRLLVSPRPSCTKFLYPLRSSDQGNKTDPSRLWQDIRQPARSRFRSHDPRLRAQLRAGRVSERGVLVVPWVRPRNASVSPTHARRQGRALVCDVAMSRGCLCGCAGMRGRWRSASAASLSLVRTATALPQCCRELFHTLRPCSHEPCSAASRHALKSDERPSLPQAGASRQWTGPRTRAPSGVSSALRCHRRSCRGGGQSTAAAAGGEWAWARRRPRGSLEASWRPLRLVAALAAAPVRRDRAAAAARRARRTQPAAAAVCRGSTSAGLGGGLPGACGGDGSFSAMPSSGGPPLPQEQRGEQEEEATWEADHLLQKARWGGSSS